MSERDRLRNDMIGLGKGWLLVKCDRRMKNLDKVIECNLAAGHEGNHEGKLYATKIVWMEDDRRTYTGDWVDCPESGCILPANHRGNHAW